MYSDDFLTPKIDKWNLKELPEENGVYYTYSITPNGNYVYSYKAFMNKSWWEWDYKKRFWTDKKNNDVIGWVVPSESMKRDDSLLKEMIECF